MFHKVFVEKDLGQSARVQNILSKLRPSQVEYIDRYDHIWGQVKRPYQQKLQTNPSGVNLFIAKKRGQLIRPAPTAYGTADGAHYYFIHAFNCIYQCEYCYLQGHFHTPDLVFFVNHEEILLEMKSTLKRHQNQGDTSPIWFHGGEFSDSLALSHITDELDIYFNFFYQHPQAHLELRTKSANIQKLMNLSPAPNIVVSYSLSPAEQAREMDHKVPSIKARLQAIAKLAAHGHRIGIHFDPIVDSPQLEEQYTQLLDSLAQVLPWSQLAYLSLGVVRFTPAVYQQVQQNYPQSKALRQELIKSFDGKIRYSRPHRGQIFERIKKLCLAKKLPAEKIYLCME